MDRTLRIAGYTVAALIGSIAAIVIVLLTLADSDSGRKNIEHWVARLSNGHTVIAGLSGHVSGGLRIVHLELSDDSGIWLTGDGISLDWSPLRLLTGRVKINDLSADRVVLARLPSPSQSAAGNSGFNPPLGEIRHLEIKRLEVPRENAEGAKAVLHASGDVALTSGNRGTFNLSIDRLDTRGSYQAHGIVAANRIDCTITATEADDGLLANRLGINDTHDLNLNVGLSGPRTGVAASLLFTVGTLKAAGNGTLDLDHGKVDFDLTAATPTTTPWEGVSWNQASLDAHVHGAMDAPDVTADLNIKETTVQSLGAKSLTANLHGRGGKVTLNAAVDGLRLPGSRPEIFAAVPFEIRADVILNAADHPVNFTISHPLINIAGKGQLTKNGTATASVTSTSLRSFAQMAGLDVNGSTAMNLKLAGHSDGLDVGIDGGFHIDEGAGKLAELLRGESALKLEANLKGGDIILKQASFTSSALHANATGLAKQKQLDLDWKASLVDLSRVLPSMPGTVLAQGHIKGPQDRFHLTMTADGQGRQGSIKSAVKISAEIDNLPNAPSGQVDVKGILLGSPISVAARLEDSANATHLIVSTGQWRSAAANGDLVFRAGAQIPVGHLQFHVTDLSDLQPLLGTPVSGSVDLTFDTGASDKASDVAQVNGSAQNLNINDVAMRAATLQGEIRSLLDKPNLALTLTFQNFGVSEISGDGQIGFNGPLDALALDLSSHLNTPRGPADLSLAGIMHTQQRNFELAAFSISAAGEGIQSLSPARFNFADGLTIDNLRLAWRDTVFAAKGRVAPSLDLTASARDMKPGRTGKDGVRGHLSGEAVVRGPYDAPEGTVKFTGKQLRVMAAFGEDSTVADIDIDAVLKGGAAQLNSRINTGNTSNLTITGAVPFHADGALAIQARGMVDAAIANPFMAPGGRSLGGQLSLDVNGSGTLHSPRVAGRAQLVRGSLEDFVEGIHLSDLNASVTASETTVHIEKFTGRAGEGTFAVNGDMSLSESGFPINLTITAKRARLLSSDLITARMDADLTMQGHITRDLALRGRLAVDRADINVPENFPPAVVVLDVRRRGEAPPPPPEPAFQIGLEVTVDAPRQVFVRGHGLDAEMGGRLQVRGDTAQPEIRGGFDLRHGSFSLAGQNLELISGKISFDGSSPGKRFDPLLNFVGQKTASGVTAYLEVTGYADIPKIKLSSSPELPQDEILAHLLFGQSMKDLSPFQIAQIAQVIASLGGAGSGADPLAAVRKGLGLDRLSATSASTPTGGDTTTLEAGKYVKSGVYVGTKQGIEGGTQAHVQIDITRHLKLETTVGTGGGAPTKDTTLDNDPGSSVGLTYQFDY